MFLPVTAEEKGYTCKEIDVEGEITEGIVTEIEVEPLYTECEQYENGKGTGTSITIITNECHYLLKGKTAEGNPTGGEHATVDIIWEGKSIEIRATGFKFKCSTVGTQETKHAVTYGNVDTGKGKAHVEVKATAHGIDSTTQGVCGEGTHTNGSYTGNAALTTKGGGGFSVTAT